MTILLPRDRRYSRYLFDYSARFAIERNAEQAISGQAATSSRASIGSYIGSDGRLGVAPYGAPRYQWFDLDADGVREAPCRLLEDTRTNLLLRAEEIDHASWTKTNITVTANATTAPDGTLTADRIEATASASTSLVQSATVAATAAAYSIFIKRGSGATDGTRFGIRNATTASDLLFVEVNLDTLAITYLAGASGASLEDVGNGWYRLFLGVSAGISSGNSITVYAGFTGNSVTAGVYCYVWGAQLEAAPSASSYIKTTSASVTRSADAMSVTLNVLPRAMTIYVRFVERGTILTGSTSGLLGIGASVNPSLLLYNSSGQYAVTHRRSSDVTSSVAGPPSLNQLVELMAVLYLDGSVELFQSVAGGAAASGGRSGAFAPVDGLASAWNNTTLTLNERGGAVGYSAINAVRIAAGAQTLAYMRNG